MQIKVEKFSTEGILMSQPLVNQLHYQEVDSNCKSNEFYYLKIKKMFSTKRYSLEMENTCELSKDTPETVCTGENNTQIVSPTPPQQCRKLSKLRKLEFVLSILNQLLIGFVTFYICWMCLRIGDWEEIPWHALFCILGFLCLMSEGLLAHYLGNSWTQSCNRNDKTRTHWILQIFGTLLGISGILVKMFLEEQHFNTLHGKFGLATLILLFWSLITGLSSLYAHEMRHRIQPMINKATHTILGLLTYVSSVLSIVSSFETDIFLEYSLDGRYYIDFRLFLQISVVCIFILSSYGPVWCFIYSKLWKR